MTSPEGSSAGDGLSGVGRAGLALLTSWMSDRYFRTFRPAREDPEPFDAALRQRERRIGVSVAELWDPPGLPPAAAAMEGLLSSDVSAGAYGEEGGAYVVWVPPGAELPVGEPARSQLRLLLARSLAGLPAGERREVRVPVTCQLAKVDDQGSYVSVAGGLSPLWTHLSEEVPGAFHLDSRALHRLPEQEAERAILISRVRDRAQLLAAGEVSAVPLHDYWLLSRLPADEPPGVTLVAAPPPFSPVDGSLTRRLLRRAVARAASQRAGREVDLAVLLVIAPIGHMEEELVTTALRGMSPQGYSSLDLIALVGDGQVRQVLQPRSLPW